ncbi:MAG: hypothetical protein QE263_01765 [Vampirovibrionales bacterium]|nr:hypothetical protein [Vampirovibrionales bacterium]
MHRLSASQTIDDALDHIASVDAELLTQDSPELLDIGDLRNVAQPFHQPWIQANTSWVASPRALQRMQAMHMGSLPLAAVAFPQSLVGTVCRISQTPIVQTESVPLSKLFSPYLTAALYELQSLCQGGNIQAYMIGGQVRDVLLRRDHRFDMVDVDITVEANALETAQFLVAHSKNFLVDDVFPQFGTVTLSYKESLRFDLASTRQEVYDHCGALPTVQQQGVALPLDVVRRDFTINTLAMPIHELGQVRDYTSGLVDLSNKMIRILHPLSFYEDPSRILRALRFACRLGFELDPLTAFAMEQCLAYCETVYPGGGDRIRCELWDFLSQEATPTKARWLQWFVDIEGYRLISTQWPETSKPLASEDDTTCKNTHIALAQSPTLLAKHRSAIEPLLLDHAEDDLSDEGFSPWEDFQGLFSLWLLTAPLLHPTPALPNPADVEDSAFRLITKRLELTRHERDWLVRAHRLIHNKVLEGVSESTSPLELYQAWHRYPLESLLLAALTLPLLNPLIHSEQVALLLTAISRFERRLRPLRPRLNGDDLRGLGFQEGAVIGQALSAILHQKLMGQLPTAESEEAFVRKQFLPSSTEPLVERPLSPSEALFLE